MKAIVQNSYGSPDILELKEVDKPGVGDNDVLVRVHGVGLNAGDVFSIHGSPWLARFSVGFPKPKDFILGWDVAGRVEAIGAKVTRFQPGDAVYCACTGALAEFARAPEDEVALKPASLTFEQAAAVPTAALTALQGLRDHGKLQPGQQVLINGASGGVGTFAVQIAKALGAEVTGVCSTRNLELVKSIGADHVVDYTQEDFTQGGRQYDLILDNVANRSFSDLRRALAPAGVVMPNSGHGGMGYVIMAFLRSPFVSQQGRPFVASLNSEDLDTLTSFIEAGQITPVIDRTYPLDEAIAALTYLEKGHARGKVVVTIVDAKADEAAATQETASA